MNEIYTPMKSTFSGLQFCCRQHGSIYIRLAAVAFQMYHITRNSQNFTLQQFKVIQGLPSWCQWKANVWLHISH